MAFLAPLAGVAAASAGATTVGLGVASVGVSLIGAGVSAYSTLKAGKANQAQANFEADQMEQSAVIAGYNARNALANGEREVAEIEDMRIRAIASQETAVAGSGLTISGSAIDVMRDSVIEAEKDITNARYGARVEAYNYGTQAKSLLTSSSYTRTAGKNARRSSVYSAIGGAFDSLSRAGSSYYNLRTSSP